MVDVLTPFEPGAVEELKVGDKVGLSGTVYTGRDRTHQRFVETLEAGGELPFSPAGQTIFYAGPTGSNRPPGVGSVGPTTASRLDQYTPAMLDAGIKGMIGKGSRSPDVIEAIREHRAVYCLAAGGAAAFLSQYVKSARVLAYEELGPEAVYELVLDRFPLIVAVDSAGRDIFALGPEKFRRA
ncbi:MAG: FumA C-terminus/TtdB family hydratase beta subunit [Terriglobia bacterium]